VVSNTRIVKNLPDNDLMPLYYHLKSEIEKEVVTKGLSRTFEEVLRELTRRGLTPMSENIT